MGRDGGKPLLLLIGSSARRSREFILRTVSRRYALWLLQPAPVTWEEPYVAGSTQVDNTRPELLMEAARGVAAEREVAGVFCYDEGLVTPAAHVAQSLGLPGNSPETVTACRDKNATRVALERAGVAQPASIGVRSLDEARDAAEKLGFPVVLKPRGLAGGMGVRRADGPDEVESAYRAASGASYPGVPVFEVPVLVEAYVDGPEISVDAVFFEGECIPLAVARKQVGLAPFFEETGHEVDAADPLLSDPHLLGALRASHAALGFHTGVSHTEFRLTANGPCLMEVNARLGGDMIPYLGELATGVDVAMAAADVAAGRRPETAPSRRRAAAITFLYPERDVEIEAVTVREDHFPPEIHSADVMADPGAVLRLPPRGYISRYARVISLADTMEQARTALLKAPELVELAGRPVEESS
ncbi:ATP-grasp domain-containing protein [Streptomyces sp. DSM 41972]|uniref:ATP-grasp domain-containing protein n=1 Tax=Streptomyces althioticus subsp. attaecolombicae TaxID=3075534 RepID=A0ABU3I040_9ACTN|nr:ATP-grasp domain-containing protein [Streptomyces sp. DSM 41972]SCD88877.1 ATP-grasp domain-containing protein [Streptomyces sp. di50b]SCE41421.1 ATP-grasp domain-containing protein [Streptomyces sp. di188]